MRDEAMGDMRVTGRYLKPVRQPLDDQLLNILNNPKMSEPAKVAALQQAIAKLSEPEKKALYERLKDKDTKDPLGRQLHYRLSHHSDKPSRLSTVDQILEALKPTPATAAHTAGSDPISQFGAPPDGEGGTATPMKSADLDVVPTATALKEAKVLMGRGIQLLKEHRYNEALATFQEGFRTYPDPAFILNEASTLFDAGRHSEAVLAYERYLSDPNAPRADEARAAMERAKAAMGGREATITGVVESRNQFEKGAEAFQAGRYQEALDAFDKAYELNPLAEFRFNQASCLEKLGRPYAAADRLQAYLDAKPAAKDTVEVTERMHKLRTAGDKAPITATGMAGGQEWMSRGNRLLFARRFDEAVKAFQEGFRTYPDPKFILNEAAALLEGGRYAEADLAYGRYLSNPNAPRADEARTAQAGARSHMGGHEATATGVVESQRLFEQGNDLYKAGRYHDAFQAFERAYAQNPLGVLRYNQAACLDKLGKRELAAQRYEAYLAETPNAPDAAKVRAHITKLHADALKAAQSAFDRAQTAYGAGNFKEAASAFAEAYEQKPFPQFLYNMAAAYEKAGDSTRAVQNYQLYLSMAPDAKDADKVRRHIHTLLKATGNDLMQP